MKLLLGLFVALVSLNVSASAAYAEASYKQCKVVSNSAEINFDATLTVSIYEHRPTKFCSIDVHPGPSPGGTVITAPAIAAAQGYQQLVNTKPSDTNAAWNAYIPVLMQALVQPWRTSQNADQLGALENTLVGQESATLRQCVMDAVFKLEPFGRRTEVISCGIVEGNSFVIEAVSEAIRLVLILPGPLTR
ncbi:hypothetical protein [Rhizobium leguminosarum]|uniref:hypothetical protein n=1 Tax=Rhizobium leguminosarum TaxID=384 RepID=UPI00103088C6|nr:hypothetical protein [Rhizobium leguminosarum]TBF75776.1 hypothetical protein ELG84_24125 [Rhizobium leguminosarum]